MFTRAQPHHNSHPIKTLIGTMGILFGIIFLLSAFNVLDLSFYMTNAVYLKIFAVYAILSGLMLVMNIQNHGIIRY